MGEDRQTSELLGHQHDVYNETAKRLKEEIDELQERQAHELVEHRQNLHASTILRQQKLLSSQKDDIQAEIDAEMASVLSKVRADIESDASKDRKNRTREL